MNLANLKYLHDKTLNQAFASAENLKSFLDAMAWLYKYPFNNQAVIYAQIKYPTAVATFDQWKRLGRNVNRGAVGTFYFSDGAKGIRADLFDIADTNGATHTLPRLWQLPEEPEAICRGLMNPGEDFFQDTLNRLTGEAVGTVMATLPEDTFGSLGDVRRALSSAVGYTVANRLDFQVAFYEDALDWEYSRENPFAGKTMRDKINIATVMSQSAAQVLRQIERSVKYESERHRTKGAGTIATADHEERPDLPAQRGDADIPRDRRTGRTGDVRRDTGENAPGTQPSQVPISDGGREADGIPDGNQRALLPDSGEVHGRRDGAATGGLPGTGTVERAAFHGGEGAGDGRTQPPGNLAVYLGITGETLEEIKGVIAHGDGFTDNQQRIGAFFIEENDPGKRVAFLKTAYGTAYNSWGFSSRLCNLNSDIETGIQIHLAATDTKPAISQSLDWESAQLVIAELVAEGRFAAQETTEEKNTIVISQPRRRSTSVSAGQQSLFADEPDDPSSLLREQLTQRYARDSKAWHDILRQGYSRADAIKAIKKHYGWQGSSIHLPNGQSGYITFSNKGVTIQTYDANMTELNFTWSTTVDAINEILDRESEFEIWSSVGNLVKAEAEGTRPPTLKDILLQMDAAPVKDFDPMLEYEKISQMNLAGKVQIVEDIEPVSLEDTAFQQYPNDLSLTDDQPVIAESQEAADPVVEGNTPVQLPKSKPAPKIENYRYPDEPGAGDFQSGAKARFKDNILAIKTLNTIEIEKRGPTPEEQTILARYAGWGGLSEAFDKGNASWSNEYQELRELLDARQYAGARASTTTGFYTPIPLIRFIYSAVRKFGFEQGRVLEPSAGTGRFFGAIPHELSECDLYGVEPDGLSARIAGKLYPGVTVFRGGYESTQLSDNHFDIAVGNVPFGGYQLADPRYDKHHFLIHDFFFAKTLDKLRPGGILAFITSTGTMDKKSEAVRSYLAQRSDLIGAVRLPDSAFRSTGTSVSTDIIFLQKREQPRDMDRYEPTWIKTGELETDITVNQYFLDHPEMVMGVMKAVSGPYGPEAACVAHSDIDLDTQLAAALEHLNAYIPPWTHEDIGDAIEAPPDVKNFTFTELDGKLYYREHNLLLPQDMGQASVKRIAGMHQIRQTLRRIIELQPTSASDMEIAELRETLSDRYDSFVGEYGELNSRVNQRLFAKDIDCNLLRAIEKKQDDGTYAKTDIFLKRTVDPRKIIRSADNAFDALYISLNQHGKINFHTIISIYPKEFDEIVAELGYSIYQNPDRWNNNPWEGWETREEYLSGNVRKKLASAIAAAGENPDMFSRNIAALEKNLPDWIEAGQIEARLGASWIGKEYFQQFMYEAFNTPVWLRGGTNQCIRIEYNSYAGKWSIQNGSSDSSVQVREVLGTSRINAYALLEDALNLSDTTVKDRKEKDVYVVNERETQLARGKQTQIKNAFRNWIFADSERRHLLVERYNDLFNAVRIREYDGSRLQLPGLSATFNPYGHQRNAVARICDQSYHTLLDHKVGAGKTATMIIGAYERLRMGISNRSMFVVPNHIVGQFGDDVYKLYPDAKAMVVREADFEKSNRQQFLSRIVYSDIQMIVIGHSQFERIPMSDFYREQALNREIAEISASIALMRKEQGSRWSVKQMEAQQISLETQLKRLQNENKKDGGIVTFEEMGIDHLSVDEADVFKNCYIFTKLRNVAGIGTAASQRAADMLMKCRYLNESGGKIVFATGTPISNALSEMYVMQRYLQEDLLHGQGIYHFDEWVADFAETTSNLEMAPEGIGYRPRTRLSKYFNLPELMQLYRQVADVQTEETLNLKTPKVLGGEPVIVLCQPSDELLLWVQDGVERCRRIRQRLVDPSCDNMLKFTLEAKLAGLDMRLVDPGAGYDPDGKIAECANKLFSRYEETHADRGVQLVFCDSSTPNPKKFNVYSDLKRVCIEKGIPADEIAFIHDAKNDRQKEALFNKCRSGEVRVLIGSTEKCGAGTNIQDRLAALHHLDCPYRPRDLEQRNGRILRQGNMYPEVSIYQYVTEKSFDAYLWSIITTKQRFISQIRQGSSGQRSFEDKDETLLSFEAVQAVASGDPRIMEKINLDNELSRLQLLQADYNSQRYRLQDKINIQFPSDRQRILQEQEKLLADVGTTAKYAGADTFQMEVGGTLFPSREDAGNALIAMAKKMGDQDMVNAGKYKGLSVLLNRSRYQNGYTVTLAGQGRYTTELNEDTGTGTSTRIDNLVKSLPTQLQSVKQQLQDLDASEKAALAELERPFEYLDEINRGIQRQAELNAELNLDKKEAEVLPEDELQHADMQEDGLELGDEADYEDLEL